MSHAPSNAATSRKLQLSLALGALGVVFGDIGTSPLYALRESVAQLPEADRVGGVYGILSLIFWALMLVVSLKYVTVVMRANNQGEGGVFTLLALSGLDRAPGVVKRIPPGVVVLLVGASMICGEGVITPAVSVLSASEGLKMIVPGAEPVVLPLCLIVLVTIFLLQRRGTKAIGQAFGPVMLIWFLTLGLLGLWRIFEHPDILRALNPLHGLRLLLDNPHAVLGVLGGIVLAITGVEALFADMGHFGRPAILRAWYGLVLPGLALNYFGQGAHVLANPGDISNPFLSLAPEGAARAGLMVLSIFAAVIASQAFISGTFSLIRQAIQLGYFPRLKVLHTNPDQRGQIYVPMVNFTLALGSIATVLLFGSSSNIAGAYGVAVTATMVVTTIALYFVARRHWRWSIWQVLPMCLFFGSIDVSLFIANLHKFWDGGWLPLAIGATMLAIMHTWKSGRNEIQDKVYGGAITELELSSIARSKNIVRVPGSAVFMVATPKGTPLALLHHLKANKCLQQTVVLLTIVTEEVPTVPDEERMSLAFLGEGVWRAVGRYGYMESPDVSWIIERVRGQGVAVNPLATTYYFNREMILTGGNARMFEWQKALYGFLSRNARPVKDYYRIMPTQIIEIGLPVQL